MKLRHNTPAHKTPEEPVQKKVIAPHPGRSLKPEDEKYTTYREYIKQPIQFCFASKDEQDHFNNLLANLKSKLQIKRVDKFFLELMEEKDKEIKGKK